MNPTNFELHHEKLDIYKCSIELLSLTTQILEDIPKGYSEYKDQLKRASLSIVLNFSEGYGKFSTKDKKRFYAIAKGSAHECGALLDSMKILKMIDLQKYSQGKNLLYRIVSMLVKMCL